MSNEGWHNWQNAPGLKKNCQKHFLSTETDSFTVKKKVKCLSDTIY